MSHRTQDLPPKQGLARLLRELRYHEASRQVLAIVLIALYAATARPTALTAAIGLPLAVLGTAVRLYASGFIMKNTELATTGPYSLVRHPLYTGNILLIVGFAVANALWWAVPLALVFFWFYYPTAIEYEDRKLGRLFGARWEEWATRTPALMPNFKHAEGGGSGSWSFAKSMRQNGEFVIAGFVVLSLALVIARL